MPSPPRACVPWVLLLKARQPPFALTNTSTGETVAFRPVVNMTNLCGTSTKYQQTTLVEQMFQMLLDSQLSSNLVCCWNGLMILLNAILELLHWFCTISAKVCTSGLFQNGVLHFTARPAMASFQKTCKSPNVVCSLVFPIGKSVSARKSFGAATEFSKVFICTSSETK